MTLRHKQNERRTLAHLTRRVQFSAMHQLCNSTISTAENDLIFGKCYRLHGHDYKIEVKVKGEIDSSTGMICGRDLFEEALNKEVVQKFDKTNLNIFMENTTGELFVQYLFDLLKEKLKPLDVISVRLQETSRNHFTAGSEEVFSKPHTIK
jgi:6-pyruvoyltetrahydropterin/6-carboxytetrahydropterin synthase